MASSWSWSFFAAVLLLCASGFNCKVTRGNNGTLNITTFTDVNVVSDLKTEFDGKGLEPWYNVAKSFIHTVQNDNLPFGDVKTDYKMEKFLKGWEMPFIIVFAIGLLFAVILPFVGLCFCCCRCCGNCGGEMVQKESDHNSKKRIIFSVILTIITLLMFAGCLMAFVSNDRITDTVKSYRHTPLNAINDVESYFNQTLQIVNEIIIEDVIDVLVMVGEDIVTFPADIVKGVKASFQTSVKDPLDRVVKLATDTNTMEKLLKNVTEKTEKLKSDFLQLDNDLKDVDKNLTALCSGGLCVKNFSNSLQTNANFTSLPDVSDQLKNITDVVKNLTLEENARKGLQQFDDIDQRVINETKDPLKDITEVIREAKETFKKDIKEDVTEKLNEVVLGHTKEWTDKINDVFDDQVEPNDKYRYYAAVGITCLILLPVVLMAIGLLCGTCGYQKDSGTTDRGGISHTGGNMLMAAVGFMFIFVFFLMIFTSLCFFLGANFEATCRSVRDDSIFTDFFDDPSYWDGKYILSDAIYDNGSIKLTIKSVIESCRKNEAVYQAIQGYNKWNLSDKFNVRKELGDFEGQLNNFSVNLDGQDLLNNDTKKGLKNLEESGVDTINFTKFLEETGKSVVNNLTGLENDIRAKNNSKLDPIAARLIEIGTDVEKMQNLSKSLENDVVELQILGGNIKTHASEILEVSEEAAKIFLNDVNGEVKKIVLKFSDKILGYIDQIRDVTQDLIENKLGRCKVLANIYDAGVNLVCRDTVYPFNGYWFSIGFCLFFYIPAIIFSVKLAKHYRKMDFEEGFDRQDGHEMTQFDRNKPWLNQGNAVYPK